MKILKDAALAFLIICTVDTLIGSSVTQNLRMKQKNQATGIAAANKKKKLNPALTSPLSVPLLSVESKQTLTAEFRTAAPFPHCLLRPLCDDSRLKEIFEESLQNLRADLKVHDVLHCFTETIFQCNRNLG